MYYIADCSTSGLNPHSVTFYLDSSCSTVATSAANQPFTAPGTTAALEYPCVQMTATTSISAGMWNEALWGIGSVLVWRNSGTCQGMANGPGGSAQNVVSVPACPIARVLLIRVFKCLLPHNHTCRPSRPVPRSTSCPTMASVSAPAPSPPMSSQPVSLGPNPCRGASSSTKTPLRARGESQPLP